MEELKQIVARNIINLRTANCMTQAELGKQLNYSDKAVSRWECGESIPEAGVLLQISHIFNVTVDSLLSASVGQPAPAKHGAHHHRTITLISVIGIWTLALLAFIIVYLTSSVLKWLIFTYALPVSLIAALVLNAVWGKAKYLGYIISLLMWSILLCIYLHSASLDWLIIFSLGIPAQAIICLCFRLLPKR